MSQSNDLRLRRCPASRVHDIENRFAGLLIPLLANCPKTYDRGFGVLNEWTMKSYEGPLEGFYVLTCSLTCSRM